MAQNQINSLVATTSGVFGGMGKVLLGNVYLASITFASICEVAIYAAISALVGYENFRGKQGFAHEVEVIITVDKGVAKANGRFGSGEI